MARPIEKREHIERAVVAVVARKGLHGVTIQDIAIEAGVSPGLLYRYWENREALAAEMYRTHYAALMQRLTAKAAELREPMAKLRAMLTEFLRFADEDHMKVKFLLLSQHDLGASVPAEETAQALAARLIASGREAKKMRAVDPAVAAHLVLGLVLQPVIGVLYGRMAGPMSKYLGPITDAVERVLLLAPRKRKADEMEGAERATLRSWSGSGG